MKIVTRNDTVQSEIRTAAYCSLVRSYFGKFATAHEGPQAFFVDMPGEGSTITPHFHDVDQFQIVVRGGGRIGKKPLYPVTFHYADAYTPYGPIVGGEQGIVFFTLRAACASGYFPMPGSRHLMRARAGRTFSGLFNTVPPPAENEVVREPLLSTADGIEVVGLRLGSAAFAAGEPADSGNQFYLVCSGSLRHKGAMIGEQSLMLVESGEVAPTLEAGPEGAEVLLLQMPITTARVGSSPGTLVQRGLSDYAIPNGVTID